MKKKKILGGGKIYQINMDVMFALSLSLIIHIEVKALSKRKFDALRKIKPQFVKTGYKWIPKILKISLYQKKEREKYVDMGPDSTNASTLNFLTQALKPVVIVSHSHRGNPHSLTLSCPQSKVLYTLTALRPIRVVMSYFTTDNLKIIFD